jgi:hypothetical protein
MKILIKGALFGITMIWVYLFLANMARIGPALGFDISHHLDYIRFILEKQSIPLASDDWTTFHPPLFYLLSSGFLKTFGFLHFSVKPFLLLKIIPFLCGVGNVWVAYGLARAVFKDDLLKILLAVVFAGFIPMNIYMSAYVGNEPLHAFLAGSSLLMTVHILRGPDIRISQMVYLGLLMGLAVLTKITAWVLVPVVLIFLAYKMIRVDRNKFQEVVLKSGLLFAGIFMISGWYYVRNVIHFGRPFVINWNLPGQRWWQDPGFHTIRYYLNFGEALRHPYFSSFHSFWDSIYSTFWGDGLIAGNVIPDRPDVWNYDYMSTVYLLALPATGIFFIGLLRAIQMVLKKREPTSRLITAFLLISLYSICLFILFSTLGVPIYSQAKAFYCLSVMGPMSVIFALGLGTIHDWVACPRYLGRACLYGWIASLVSMIFLSFGA